MSSSASSEQQTGSSTTRSWLLTTVNMASSRNPEQLTGSSSAASSANHAQTPSKSPESPSQHQAQQPVPADRNPINGARLGTGTDLSIEEILTLPKSEQDRLAKEMNVLCWDPFTVQAICSMPGSAYDHIYSKPMPIPEPIPDHEEDQPVPAADRNPNSGPLFPRSNMDSSLESSNSHSRNRTNSPRN